MTVNPAAADCPDCHVPGCVCDWCDDCARHVNPYTHFLEWNPSADSGCVSDGAIREVLRLGSEGPTS